MIDMVDQASKVMIYSPQMVMLGRAVIESITADDEMSLVVGDEVFDLMSTSFVLVLSNDSYGLISYKAELVTFRRESIVEGTYVVVVKPIEFIERVQRRENFKIKVSDSVILRIGPDECPAQLKDISASGVMITVDKELEIGQIFDFTFDQLSPPLDYEAEVLRLTNSQDGVHEYGCRFINMTVEKESSIRRHIFRLQLTRAASSPAFRPVENLHKHDQD